MKQVRGRAVALLVAGIVVSMLATRGQESAPAPSSAPVTSPAVTPDASPAFLLRDDSGIDFVHRRFMTPGKKYLNEVMGSGVGLLDYDGDGRLDVYCVQCCPLPGNPVKTPAPPDALYHNEGRGADGRVRFARVADSVAVKKADGTVGKKPLGLGDREYGM